MADNRNNVLLPMAMPTQKSLRAAVANIIRRVQLDKHLTDDDLGDALACSVGTVRNARNELADLNATTIARIGARFGGEYLDPYSRLWGARNVPLDVTEAGDALPSMSAAVHRLAVAQSPDSHGGRRTTHCELLAMLPDLLDAQRAINALIVSAQKVAA